MGFFVGIGGFVGLCVIEMLSSLKRKRSQKASSSSNTLRKLLRFVRLVVASEAILLLLTTSIAKHMTSRDRDFIIVRPPGAWQGDGWWLRLAFLSKRSSDFVAKDFYER